MKGSNMIYFNRLPNNKQDWLANFIFDRDNTGYLFYMPIEKSYFFYEVKV